MRRMLAMLVLAAGVITAFALVQEAKPGWWQRLWYPLQYEQIVRGHARNYGLDPALLAAVI
jgi:soluble lytic murein transglycosylase